MIPFHDYVLPIRNNPTPVMMTRVFRELMKVLDTTSSNRKPFVKSSKKYKLVVW